MSMTIAFNFLSIRKKKFRRKMKKFRGKMKQEIEETRAEWKIQGKIVSDLRDFSFKMVKIG